jgi:cyclic pyranopterin phosphate synthase
MALLPVAEALERVLAQASALPAERVPLAEAHGRVLADDVRSLRTQPPADVSAMDGYAVRAEDVVSAPTALMVVGEIAAGKPFDGEVRGGQAVRMSAEAYRLVAAKGVAKGDVLTVAELAGVMGAKRTAELIPLCHPLALEVVTVEATLDESLPGVRVRAVASLTGRTGVEMEALTAVSVACLTVYDMVKAVDRAMVIEAVHLVSKTGGTRSSTGRNA